MTVHEIPRRALPAEPTSLERDVARTMLHSSSRAGLVAKLVDSIRNLPDRQSRVKYWRAAESNFRAEMQRTGTAPELIARALALVTDGVRHENERRDREVEETINRLFAESFAAVPPGVVIAFPGQRR